MKTTKKIGRGLKKIVKTPFGIVGTVVVSITAIGGLAWWLIRRNRAEETPPLAANTGTSSSVISAGTANAAPTPTAPTPTGTPTPSTPSPTAPSPTPTAVPTAPPLYSIVLAKPSSGVFYVTKSNGEIFTNIGFGQNMIFYYNGVPRPYGTYYGSLINGGLIARFNNFISPIPAQSEVYVTYHDGTRLIESNHLYV